MLTVSPPKCCFPFHSAFARRQMPGLSLSIKVRCQELVFRDQKTASNGSEYSDQQSIPHAYLLSTWRIWRWIAIGTFQVRIHSVAIWKFGQELPQLTKRPLTNFPVVTFTSVRGAANVWRCCLGFRTVLWSLMMIGRSWSINGQLFFSFFLLFLLLLLLAFSFSFAISLRPNSFFSTSSLFFSFS